VIIELSEQHQVRMTSPVMRRWSGVLARDYRAGAKHASTDQTCRSRTVSESRDEREYRAASMVSKGCDFGRRCSAGSNTVDLDYERVCADGQAIEVRILSGRVCAPEG
jgi:hypothetical protein